MVVDNKHLPLSACIYHYLLFFSKRLRNAILFFFFGLYTFVLKKRWIPLLALLKS